MIRLSVNNHGVPAWFSAIWTRARVVSEDGPQCVLSHECKDESAEQCETELAKGLSHDLVIWYSLLLTSH